jgi:YidC/Oxa1 family membrane protein insertase
MDKKNTTIGILLLLAAFGLWIWQAKQTREAEAQQASRPQVQQVEQASAPAPAATTAPAAATPSASAAAETPEAPEEKFVLENDFIRVHFTSLGGAVEKVEILDYKAEQGGKAPYAFNEGTPTPIYAIDQWRAGVLTSSRDSWTVVEKTATKVVFQRTVAPGVTALHSYEISLSSEGPAPYTIRQSYSLANGGSMAYSPDTLFINLGTAAPDKADSYGYSLNAGYYDGEDFIYEAPSYFQGGGWFTHSAPKSHVEWSGNVVWATTKNQFFASIATPVKPAQRVISRPVPLGVDAEGKPLTGLSTSIGFDLPVLAAGGSANVSMDCYMGPKEYRRLSLLSENQDKVMKFGWSTPLGFLGAFVGFIGKLFYMGLTALQHVTINWGVAIILMTILIRLVFWPLTAKAAESSRKMAKLQKPLKELQEKYKDNPKKRNEETLELWKKHKVNPLAGCLPILIQMPIFIAFYYMLRGASELRFAHFLWIGDLSLPDTVASIGGFPINIMPILMGVSMFYQMHLAPSPSTDPLQAKLMKFMPLIFLFFCYNFSSGLVLYWTVSNCMSILQQLQINRKRDAEEAAEAAAAIATGSLKTSPASVKGPDKKKKK